MEKPYKLRIVDAELSVQVSDNPDYVNFTIEAEQLYSMANIHMKDVIQLHKYLGEEIEKWLND